jgi:hypothetical protein
LEAISKGVNDNLLELDLNALNNYFGSQITLYFGWLEFYNNALKIPAVFGLILFARQVYTGEVDNPWAPLFMLCITIWGTAFLEYWKQRNAALAYSWGVITADEDEKLKQIAKVRPIPGCGTLTYTETLFNPTYDDLFFLSFFLIFFSYSDSYNCFIYVDPHAMYTYVCCVLECGHPATRPSLSLLSHHSLCRISHWADDLAHDLLH